jgi:acetoacetyl-CoA synthetase
MMDQGSLLLPEANCGVDISVTHWGTSPKFLGTLMRDLNGPLPSLAALQTVLVSGSALSEELCDWFYTVFPKEVGLHNGSGGTDMLGGSKWS